MLNNPIWYREQQAQAARARRLPWWRRGRYLTLPLIWLGLMLTCCLISGLNQSRWSTPEFRESLQIATVASCYVQLGYLAFRALIVGASVLVRERELQTFDTLLSSPLPVPQLWSGKWLAATVPLLFELTLALPVALVEAAGANWLDPNRYHWVGDKTMALGQVGDCFLLSIALVLCLTSAGLLLSTCATSSGRAATQAVLVGLVLTLGTYLADVLIQVFSGARELHPLLSWLNPWTALYSIWYQASNLPVRSPIGPHLWMGTGIGYLGLAVACGLLSVYRLARPQQR